MHLGVPPWWIRLTADQKHRFSSKAVVVIRQPGGFEGLPRIRCQPQTRCALSVMGTPLPTLIAVACQPVPPLCETESTGIRYCEVVMPSSENPPAPGRNLPVGAVVGVGIRQLVVEGR